MGIDSQKAAVFSVLVSLFISISAFAAPGGQVNQSSLDQTGLEGKNELDFNPAAVELRETRAAETAELNKVRSLGVKSAVSVSRLAARSTIPIDNNQRVLELVAVYQKSSYFPNWLSRASRFAPLFQAILRQEHVPTDLIYLSMIESGFSMQAVSPVQAAGPWQFMEPTAAQFDLRVNFWVDERRDPLKATHAAARYLKSLYQYWHSWPLAWAEYNAGAVRVRRAVATHGTKDFWTLANTDAFLQETREYVPKIMAAALIAKQPAAFGFKNIRQLPPFTFDTIGVPVPTDLGVIAGCAAIPEADLQELNPELLRWVTPPIANGAYRLRVPKGTAAQALRCIAQPSTDVIYRAYLVRRGDTLRSIARIFNTDPYGIIQVNRIEGVPIRVGQALVVPVSKRRLAENNK